MAVPLDETADDLGEGTLLPLGLRGETLFKLDSYPGNPIVTPKDLGLTWHEDGEVRTGAVFNAGAELANGNVILTARCQQGYRRLTFYDEKTGRERTCCENCIPEIWTLVSEDGVHFRRGDAVIHGDGTDHNDFVHGIEDVRILKQGSRYLLVGAGRLAPAYGCGQDALERAGCADRIAIYVTEDFREIEYCGAAGPFRASDAVPALEPGAGPFGMRNAVPILEPINGRYYILLRFRPDIQLDVLEGGVEQLLRPTNSREEWARLYQRRKETVLLKAGLYPHEREKIGAGPQVIRTERGWLLLYHAVGEIPEEVCEAYGVEGPIDRGYSTCAALLALDDPHRVLCRTRQPINVPSAPYELYGDDEYPVDVPAVVFPTGAFVHRGKLLVYAGAGDKYLVLLSCTLDKLVDYLWQHCRVAA